MNIDQLKKIRAWFHASQGDPPKDYVESIHSIDEIYEHLEELLDLAQETLDREGQPPVLQAFEHLKRAADLLQLNDQDRATLSSIAERKMDPRKL